MSPSSLNLSHWIISPAIPIGARYYALREILRFDDYGLWSRTGVWFSCVGTLLATAEPFIQASLREYFADELASALHIEVQDALMISQEGRVARQMVLAVICTRLPLPPFSDGKCERAAPWNRCPR